jgi:Ca2+-binding RTX toxin-like protein
VYLVTVGVSDGTTTTTGTIAVTVGNLNEQPDIVSDGGWLWADAGVSENATVVTTVVVVDPEGGVNFALSGADAALFELDSATGELRFTTAPDFEAPGDADGDNVYQVTIDVSDGSLGDFQNLSVTVTDVNEAPVFVSHGGGATATIAVSENSLAVTAFSAIDPEGGVVYMIAGGADAGRFTIDAFTGTLSFADAPDHDAPTDADGDNVYEIEVKASDGSLSDSQALAVTVGNLVDGLTLTGNSGGNILGGSHEEDTIRGLGGADTLHGFGASDDLDGGNGKDRLNGGAGADLLTGGASADRFEFSSAGDSTATASDTILDFSRSQGDKIELDEIDANALVGGNQAFNFIGSAAFSNAAGHLRAFLQGGDCIVEGDIDGDGVIDLRIVVDGLWSNLVSSDFLL